MQKRIGIYNFNYFAVKKTIRKVLHEISRSLRTTQRTLVLNRAKAVVLRLVKRSLAINGEISCKAKKKYINNLIKHQNMKIELTKKPKNPIIIEGFPGFGLVGSISTEFLINHLGTEQIGSIKIEEVSPLVAIHGGKVIDPIGIHYDKKNNIIIIHAITNIQGIEWQVKEMLAKLAKDLQAREIICIEGVIGGDDAKAPRSFYFANAQKNEKAFETAKIEKLKEGVVVGVTGALLTEKDLPVSSIFVETHSAMPDSKAAAKVIEVLDKYLGLNIDYDPLIKQAEVFEKKLKKVLQQRNELNEEQEKKRMSYIS